jgi:hypothetical protein
LSISAGQHLGLSVKSSVVVTPRVVRIAAWGVRGPRGWRGEKLTVRSVLTG